MVDSVNPIGSSDYLNLPEKYDFNHDGKVDTKDYKLAVETLVSQDIENYEGLTKEQLDEIFGIVVQKSGAENSNITKDNVEQYAKNIIDDMKSGKYDPSIAKTLNHLQHIGTVLSSYIDMCKTASQLLAEKKETQKSELDEIAKEKEVRETEYADKVAEVNAKQEELQAKIIGILQASNQLSAERQKQAENVIQTCVEDYKNGKYPGRELTSVLIEKIGANGMGLNISRLSNLLNSSNALGKEIKSLCADIDSLVSDIKSINEKYNSKNTEYNNTINLYNGISEASNSASQYYQTGYQKRLDMRQEIINKYHVAGNGKVKESNEQIQKLNEFLTAGELDNMPYTDAWEILSTTFDNCKIKFDKARGKISIPKGHDDVSKNVFAELVNALKRNYGDLDVQQYDEELQTEENNPGGNTAFNVKRNDPISFTKDNIKYDFIKDRNDNGILDNVNEFLGAKNGWAEMKAFDINGDGKISGSELENLNLVAINQTNGQYTFMSAAEAGISSIDLKSYSEKNTKEINLDITVGTFNIKMADGKTIKGIQTENTDKNIKNTYTNIFGSAIEDRTEIYEANPFMEEFEETVNTKNVTSTNENAIKQNKNESDAIIKAGKHKVNRKVKEAALKGTIEKEELDKKAAAKEKAKQEKAEAQKAEEEAAEAEKKDEMQKASKKKK